MMCHKSNGNCSYDLSFIALLHVQNLTISFSKRECEKLKEIFEKVALIFNIKSTTIKVFDEKLNFNWGLIFDYSSF